MLARLIDWFSALRRGEKRIAPHGARGRVYAKRDGSVDNASDGRQFRVSPTATCEAKITRADGTVEIVNLPVDIKHLGQDNG